MSLLVGFKAGFQLKYLFRKSWISSPSCCLLPGLSHRVVLLLTDEKYIFSRHNKISLFQKFLSPYTGAKNHLITESRHNLYSRLSILDRGLSPAATVINISAVKYSVKILWVMKVWIRIQTKLCLGLIRITGTYLWNKNVVWDFSKNLTCLDIVVNRDKPMNLVINWV